MPRVFLCYRREDSAGSAGRLFDRLAARFGRQSVFMDVDTVRAGQDFAARIEDFVASCDALVAVVGRDWLDAAEGGQRRIDDPGDWVRIEIEAALSRDTPVIPVLVEGAPMPRADQLPDALRLVARRQAIEITESRFDYDTGRLIDAIKAGAGKGAAPGGSRFRTLLGPFSRRPKVALATGVVVVVAIAVVATLAGQGVFTSGPAAPEDGVVDYAYMHTASPPSYANAVTSLNYRPKLLVARFDFKARPRASLPIFVDWLSPGQKLVAHVGKPNLPKVISSYYQSESPLRAGAWVAVLLVGKHRVAKAVVTLGNGKPGGGRGGAGAGAVPPG